MKEGVAPYTRYVASERDRLDRASSTLSRVRQGISELRARAESVISS